MLQRLAADAEGLWLGTNVTLLPLHNPIELAEVGAFIDVITGGKFLLGVGLGYRPEEYAMYGVPMPERVSRFGEAVGIIRRLWTEDRVTHQGRHWQFSDATIAPRPLQRRRRPSSSVRRCEAAITRAAKIGDGWLVVPIPTLDQLGKQMATYTSARAGGQAAAQPAYLPAARGRLRARRRRRPSAASPHTSSRNTKPISRGGWRG